jgi:hypothetical protein
MSDCALLFCVIGEGIAPIDLIKVKWGVMIDHVNTDHGQQQTE